MANMVVIIKPLKLMNEDPDNSPECIRPHLCENPLS